MRIDFGIIVSVIATDGGDGKKGGGENDGDIPIIGK